MPRRTDLSLALGFFVLVCMQGAVESSVIVVKEHACPKTMQPAHPFSSSDSRLACCVLDKLIGAMELLHSIHTCQTYINTPSADMPSLGLDGALLTPCYAQAAQSLHGALLSCCPGGNCKSKGGMQDGVDDALSALEKKVIPSVKRCMRLEKFQKKLPVKYGRCEEAEWTTLQLIKSMVSVSSSLYAGSPMDITPPVKELLALCSPAQPGFGGTKKLMNSTDTVAHDPCFRGVVLWMTFHRFVAKPEKWIPGWMVTEFGKANITRPKVAPFLTSMQLAAKTNVLRRKVDAIKETLELQACNKKKLEQIQAQRALYDPFNLRRRRTPKSGVHCSQLSRSVQARLARKDNISTTRSSTPGHSAD